MATIRKRVGKKGTTWLAEVRRAGQPQQTKTFATKRDAATWARALEKRLDEGGTITRETLSAVIDQFKDERTLTNYDIKILDWWEARLGSKRVSDLRKKDFTLAQADLKRLPKAKGEGTLAPATVNRRVAAISAVLSYAIEEHHLLETNPARIKSLVEDNKRDPIKAGWNDEQAAALLSACRNFTTGTGQNDPQPEPALYLLVQLGLCTGCRAGELQALRWPDVDLEAGIARITKNTRRDTTKNAESRVVPIYGEALALLREWKKTRRRFDSDYVLYNTRTQTVPYNYRPHWEAAKKTAGITNLRFHDLRHIAASTLAMSGETLGTVGAVLGHKSPMMTQRYSHYADKAVADLGKRMAEKSG